jgi:hypothetical protein
MKQLRIQSLSLLDRPYQRAFLLPIEEELKKRGHIILQASTPLAKNEVDATMAATYLFLRDEYYPQLKHPIFFFEHGVSIVKKGFREKFHIRADHMMQSGPVWHERAQWVAPKYKGNVKIGFPKSDELVKNINNMAQIKQELINEYDLDPNEPVIIYAPTWYEPGCEFPGSTTLLEQIESLGFKNLLVCFHDFDTIGKKLNGKRYIKSPNKNRFLLGADLMIGGISSIVLEYAILNKPIVQLNAHDNLDYFTIWGEKDYGTFQIAEIVKILDLKKAVDRALKDPNEYEFLRKYWVERAFYNLGTASMAAADHIEKVMQ